jgi:hypothetical protein
MEVTAGVHHDALLGSHPIVAAIGHAKRAAVIMSAAMGVLARRRSKGK